MKILYIIVPCYNEQECLPQTAPVFESKLRSLVENGIVDGDSKVLYVDDGSSDSTWDVISSLNQNSPFVSGIRLSINRGHQNALMAGLMEAGEKADITVSIDCDLQDDIDAIDRMIELYGKGFPVVCGVRKSRSSDSFLKRITARGYYALMNLFGAKIIFDHADFRLMDREAVYRLSLYHQDDLFLRGLATRLGLPVTTVTYDRAPRRAGESKYSIKKMAKLALRGFSCSRLKPSSCPRQPDSSIVERI